MSDSQPRNRRERRAAARSKSKTASEPINIPMATPDYDAKPTGKTLLDIAEERRAQLAGGTPFPKSANAGIDSYTTAEGITVSHRNGDFEFMSDEPLGAFANALIYTLSLSALHVTFDVIVLSQYNQDVVWREIAGRIARMTPALLAVVWMFHREEVLRWPRVRQAFFLGLSVAAGSYLIYAANEYGYYFVMQRAPPLGTLWVWSVVEMDLAWAVLHVMVVGGFMWSKGYGAF